MIYRLLVGALWLPHLSGWFRVVAPTDYAKQKNNSAHTQGEYPKTKSNIAASQDEYEKQKNNGGIDARV